MGTCICTGFKPSVFNAGATAGTYNGPEEALNICTLLKYIRYSVTSYERYLW